MHKLILSGYTDNIELWKLDKEAVKLDSAPLKAATFIVNDEEADCFYTYNTADGLELVSLKIIDDKIKIIDSYKVIGTKITHLNYSKVHKILFCCSYSDGSFFAVSVKDGYFQKLLMYELKSSSVYNTERSKCHCIVLSNDERKVVVINIAGDELYFYNIVKNDIVYDYTMVLPEGVGPRHGIFDQSDKLLYIVSEYSNEVLVIDVASKECIQRISTLVTNYESYGATLLWKANNKQLYVSNRGEDTIAIFNCNRGMLSHCKTIPCNGLHPRHMILLKNGAFIASCNKNSNCLSIIDTVTYKETSKIDYPNISCVCEVKK